MERAAAAAARAVVGWVAEERAEVGSAGAMEAAARAAAGMAAAGWAKAKVAEAKEAEAKEAGVTEAELTVVVETVAGDRAAGDWEVVGSEAVVLAAAMVAAPTAAVGSVVVGTAMEPTVAEAKAAEAKVVGGSEGEGPVARALWEAVMVLGLEPQVVEERVAVKVEARMVGARAMVAAMAAGSETTSSKEMCCPRMVALGEGVVRRARPWQRRWERRRAFAFLAGLRELRWPARAHPPCSGDAVARSPAASQTTGARLAVVVLPAS